MLALTCEFFEREICTHSRYYGQRRSFGRKPSTDHVHREFNRVSALTPLNDLDARDGYIERYVKDWYKVE